LVHNNVFSLAVWDREERVGENGAQRYSEQQSRKLWWGLQAFEEAYKREFGFTLEGRQLIVDDVRVRATGKVR
jgi:N-methylhydantoinase A/oxoprolinase/acetone carboxylase beta subunit